MPTIEEHDDFSDPEDEALPPVLAPSSTKPSPRPPTTATSSASPVRPDSHKRWMTLWPIWLDAKRPQRDGQRRVSLGNALRWPLAQMMAGACMQLGFQVVYEMDKTHPQDWANPGRCKVLFKSSINEPLNSQITSKRILLLRISALLRPLEPKAPAATATNPNPLPPISLRLPANSPAVSHGALEDAAKGGGMAGMMQGMLGGGGEPEVEEAPVVVPKKKIDPRLIKPRRVHVKQR